MGWIGDGKRVLDALAAAGADKDAEGKYLIRGTVASFMGAGPEVVVGDETFYFKGGKEHPLPALLAGGTLVTVIGGDHSLRRGMQG